MTVDTPDFMSEAQMMLGPYVGTIQQLAALLATGNPNGTPGGMPLLQGLDFLKGPNATLTIPAGSSAVVTANFFKPGYIFSFNPVIANAAATVPFIRIRFLWQDSTFTYTLDEEHFLQACVTSGSYFTRGSGPVRGNGLTIQVDNLDPTYSVTMTYTLAETTQHIGRDDWRGPLGTPGSFGPVPLFNTASSVVANSDLAAGIMLALFNSSIPANSSISYLLPLFCGPVMMNVISTNSINIAVSVRTPSMLPQTGYGGNAPLWLDLTLTAVLQEPMMFPRVPLIFNAQNTTGNPVQFQSLVTIEENTS